MNNDDKVVLQFDELLSALGGNVNVSPIGENTEKKKDNVETVEEKKEELIEAEATLVQTEVGNIVASDDQVFSQDDSTDKYSDLEDFYHELGMEGNETLDYDSIQLSDDLIGKACSDLFKLNNTDTIKVINLVKSYRSLDKEKREKYNVYKELPNSMQVMIKSSTLDKVGRNMMARELIEEVISCACVDTEFNKVKDLMGSIAKDMDIKNTTKMYTEYQKGLFEDNLIAHRDKIKDTDPNKAELIDKIVTSFRNAYTFDNLIEAYKNNGGAYKAKPIELEKFQTRILNNFNSKYINSTYDIPNINQAYHILDKKLPSDIDINDIKRFFILFCKYTNNYSPSVIEEHTFMYYTIMNIITLNFIDLYEENDENDFLQKVKNGIINVINTIKECDELHKSTK